MAPTGERDGLLRDAGAAHLGRVVEVARIGLVVIDTRPAEHRVVAANAVEDIETAIAPGAAVHHVVADDAGDDVAAAAAERLVVAWAAVHEVEIGSALDDVVTPPPVHEVVLRTAVDRVGPEHAVQPITPVVSVDRVVAAATADRVVAAAATDHVAPRRPLQDVRLRGSCDRAVSSRRRGGGRHDQPSDGCQTERQARGENATHLSLLRGGPRRAGAFTVTQVPGEGQTEGTGGLVAPGSP